MPRFPKPFFRADRQLWYVQLDGKQHNLGREKTEAFRRYHQLMQAPKPVASTLAAGVIEGFLDWTEQHRAPRTYDWYYDHVQSFVDSLPDKQMKTDELKPFHVEQWVDAHPTWGATYKRGAITAVQRAFLWAEKLGHIDKTPIRYIEKPKAERRNNPITPGDFAVMISHVRDQAFRDLLTFAWESGCRPQEARHIEAKHVNLARGRVEFPPEEAKGKRRWRYIYLSEAAMEIVKRLMALRKEGKLFLNKYGKPWTNYAIGCRFYRLRDKLGKRFAMYDVRHSFATRQLKSGNDPVTVAALLGHVDATMLFKIYEHISTDEEHLRERLKRGEVPTLAVVKAPEPKAKPRKKRA
jgi:integrase